MNINDPIWKLVAGAGLYVACGSRACRLAGLGLGAWGVWQFATRPKAAATALPAARTPDPDDVLPMSPRDEIY